MAWIKIKGLGKSFKTSTYSNIKDWKINEGVVWFQNRKKMLKADPDSFEAWDADCCFVARDKNHVFHGSTLKAEIDRDTFNHAGDSYWVDKDHAYCEYETSIKPIKGSSPEQFKFLGNDFARDANQAYYAGRVLKTIKSPLQFQLLKKGHCFAGDGAVVLYEGAELKGVDTGTWKHIEGGFSRDQQAIYYGSKKLPGVKAESWEIINGVYSRDIKAVYKMNLKLKDADPLTFEPPK